MNRQVLVFGGLMAGIWFLLVASGAMRGQTPSQSGCSLNASYPDSVRQWCGWIEEYSAQNGLDANLVAAVVLRESNGQPDAYSRSGAVGLMQVMPHDGLAASYLCSGAPCFADRPKMQALFDPQYNLAYGTRLLSQLTVHYGGTREALLHYGPHDVGYSYADLILQTWNDHR